MHFITYFFVTHLPVKGKEISFRDCPKFGGFLDFVAQTTRCVVFLNACHPTYGGLKVAHQLWDSVFISKLVDISDEIMYNYLIRFPGC